MIKLAFLTITLIIPMLSWSSVDLLKLHDELEAKHTNPQEYRDSKEYIFNTVDNRQGVVCSAYTPLECKNYHQSELRNKMHGKDFKMNTEHTWPQSKGAKYFPAQGDMHHLYATSKESNSMRENFPFCYVIQTFWSKQGSLQGYNADLEDCFEPLDSHKGNVARAMFYFSVRYKKSLEAEEEKLFRAWNLLDPVDQNEIIRNNRIEKIQGNRNPFIDDENLVNQISTFQY